MVWMVDEMKDVNKMNKRELREEIAKLFEVNAELKDKLDKMEYARYLSLRFNEDGGVGL